MPKNIVICADGTGNTTVKGRGTNVFKLYEAVDENGHRFDSSLIPQAAIYHDGVGTESLKWIRALSGATGWGLTRNVKQLYGELARVYDPGDQIFLLGFSRGAFTVRTLAGLIITCGILDLQKYATNADFNRAVTEAYREYRRKYQTVLAKWVRGPVHVDVAALRQRFSVPIQAFTDPTQPIIAFVGVWDTVDAVGVPFRVADVINTVLYAFKFPDLTLSEQVGFGCQALALDEARQSFTPVLWNEANTANPARVEQVWFAGVHSNVGGGYPRQGLSLVALDWMMTQAERHGLRFVPAARLAYRSAADVNDRLYDSRAGLSVFYRWQPRDVAGFCRQHGVEPKVHRTVYERIARNTSGYAPGSVPPDSVVVSTSAPRAVTEGIRALMRDHCAGQGALMDRQAPWVLLGKLSYWTFVLATLAFALLMAVTYVARITADGASGRVMLRRFAETAISSTWVGIAASTLWHHAWIGGVIAFGLALSLIVDAHLDGAYSGAWHELRVKLRMILDGRAP